ncbi:type II secretion system protein GspE, partial [Pseudomonas sp. SIMBA_068]
MLPYRLARQAGLAMTPAQGGWQLWLRRDADSEVLQELLRVHGQPSALAY